MNDLRLTCTDLRYVTYQTTAENSEHHLIRIERSTLSLSRISTLWPNVNSIDSFSRFICLAARSFMLHFKKRKNSLRGCRFSMLLNQIIDSWMRNERYNSFFGLLVSTLLYHFGTHTHTTHGYWQFLPFKNDSNAWKWSEENRITLPKQTLTPSSSAGWVLGVCKGEKRSIFTYVEQRWVDGAMQPNYKLLQPIRSVCLFYSFSISFRPSFSSGCGCALQSFCYVVGYKDTHFSAPFHVGFRSLFYVDVCLISRDERFQCAQLDWKGRNWNHKQNEYRHTLMHTIDWFGRLNSLRFFLFTFQCVESFGRSVGRNVCVKKSWRLKKTTVNALRVAWLI